MAKKWWLCDRISFKVGDVDKYLPKIKHKKNKIIKKEFFLLMWGNTSPKNKQIKNSDFGAIRKMWEILSQQESISRIFVRILGFDPIFVVLWRISFTYISVWTWQGMTFWRNFFHKNMPRPQKNIPENIPIATTGTN